MFLKVVGSRVESLTLQVNRHTDDTKDDLVRPRRARRRFFWGVRAGWMPGRKEGATKFQKGNLHMSVEEAGRRRPVQSETKVSDVCGGDHVFGHVHTSCTQRSRRCSSRTLVRSICSVMVGCSGAPWTAAAPIQAQAGPRSQLFHTRTHTHKTTPGRMSLCNAHINPPAPRLVPPLPQLRGLLLRTPIPALRRKPPQASASPWARYQR